MTQEEAEFLGIQFEAIDYVEPALVFIRRQVASLKAHKEQVAAQAAAAANAETERAAAAAALLERRRSVKSANGGMGRASTLSPQRLVALQQKAAGARGGLSRRRTMHGDASQCGAKGPRSCASLRTPATRSSTRGAPAAPPAQWRVTDGARAAGRVSTTVAERSLASWSTTAALAKRSGIASASERAYASGTAFERSCLAPTVMAFAADAPTNGVLKIGSNGANDAAHAAAGGAHSIGPFAQGRLQAHCTPAASPSSGCGAARSAATLRPVPALPMGSVMRSPDQPGVPSMGLPSATCGHSSPRSPRQSPRSRCTLATAAPHSVRLALPGSLASGLLLRGHRSPRSPAQAGSNFSSGTPSPLGSPVSAGRQREGGTGAGSCQVEPEARQAAASVRKLPANAAFWRRVEKV